MSRRGSRGTAGTLKRLAPRPKVYRPCKQPLCLILSQGSYLVGIGPDRQPMLAADPTKALRLPRDQARQVAMEMIGLGLAAEVERVVGGGGA